MVNLTLSHADTRDYQVHIAWENCPGAPVGMSGVLFKSVRAV
jgi:hypothetical protein